MQRNVIRLLALIAPLSTVLSCSDSPAEPSLPPVGKVEVTTSSFVVGVGATEQLVATVKDEAGNVLPDYPGTWISTDTQVAVVDSTGLVRGVSSGLVSIGYEAGGKTGGVNMSVWKLTVSLTPDSLILDTPGTDGAFFARISEERAGPITAATVDFVLSDTTIATLRRCRWECTGTTRGQTVFLTPRKSGVTSVIASIEGAADTGRVYVRLP